MSASQNDPIRLAARGEGWFPGNPVLDGNPDSALLPHCLKPEEIAGPAREQRVRELVRWFIREVQGYGNPKWFHAHARELAYYLATSVSPETTPPAPPARPQPGELDVDAIEARANAATPRPWAWAQTAEKGYGANVGAGCFAEDDVNCLRPLDGDLTHRTDDYHVDSPVGELYGQRAAPNAAFIAHARQDVPALIAEVRALRAALASAPAAPEVPRG